MIAPLDALDHLHAAIAAGQVLGLDVSRAAAVRAEGSERLGIAPDAYVVALVGGTGVGKSSLVNALAGRTVTAAGPRRPTTARAIAWVPAGRDAGAGSLRPLLDRLDAEVADGAAAPDDLTNVVILDLPDIDSLEPGHRAAVAAALPKVDVVAWVTDPEKYADAAFHDVFVRDWMPRLDRQIVVLNKADRLTPGAARSVVADLMSVLRREVPGLGRHEPDVVVTSASDGADGVAGLRRWLADAADAKQVIADRLVAGAAAAVAELAGGAGVAGVAPTGPVGLPHGGWIIPAASRQRATESATDEVLRVVDVPGVERRAVAATRAMARRRGTGPVGLVTSAIYRATGRHRAAADPLGYLRGWRGRGGLARAGEAVRAIVTEAMPAVPPALRGQFAEASRGGELEQRIGASVDRVIAGQGDFEPPSSRLWPVIGLLQSANTLLLIAAALWVVIWIVARPAVASYDLPVVGPVPAPLMWLGIGLVAGYILARALSVHAGWLGRRWARGIASGIRTAVRDSVAADAFAPIDRLEAARAQLRDAWTAIRR